jgi:hypothetical protein
MLWGSKDQGRFILEAQMGGAHLESNSDKGIRRIMYVCPDIAEYPGTKLLSFVWEVRRCQHLQTNSAMDQSAHPRLREVWSKLQLVKLVASDFDLAVIIDTDTVAVQCMNELFWHQAPADVWRGTKTMLSGQKRDEQSYGTPGGQGGDRPCGGFNGLPHGFLEDQKRHSWVAQKIQAGKAGEMEPERRCSHFVAHRRDLTSRKANP